MGRRTAKDVKFRGVSNGLHRMVYEGMQVIEDRAAPSIRKGKGRTYTVQILGTESKKARTWLWFWANEASSIPPSLLKAAETLRQLGGREGVVELGSAEVDLSDEVTGHTFSLIGSGFLSGAQAYYRAPHKGGAVFALIDDPHLRLPEIKDPVQLTDIFSMFTGSVSIENEVRAYKHYLEYLGWPFDESEGNSFGTKGIEITTTVAGGRKVIAGFDKDNELIAFAYPE